jgi:hypothetical protein
MGSESRHLSCRRLELPLLGVTVLCEACLLTLTVLLVRVEDTEQDSQQLLFCVVSFVSTLVVFLLSTYRVRALLLSLMHRAVTPAASRCRGRSSNRPSQTSVAVLAAHRIMPSPLAAAIAADTRAVQGAIEV